MNELLESIGGVSFVVGGVCGWLGKMVLDVVKVKLKSHEDKNIEMVKSEINRKDFMKQEEYLAAKEFNTLMQSIMPSYSFPDMEWDDACDALAYDFEKTENKLKTFLGQHGVVLDSEIRNHIGDAAAIAARGKLEITGPDISRSANNDANEMYESLASAQNKFYQLAEKQKNI